MSTATATAEPAGRSLAEARFAFGQAGLDSAERRARGCARPVRLVGSTAVVNTRTGQVGESYASADELDGYTYVRCGNRRAAVCPSCNREYKGDGWHVVMCGLAGGKGIPAAVTDHPCTI
ncbi:MAG: replication initiator [Actinomycetes bacterium]